MLTLGISSYQQDSAAALVEEGEILAAASEERFSRRKKAGDFPQSAIMACLEQVGASTDDIDAIAFFHRPWQELYSQMGFFFSQLPKAVSMARKRGPELKKLFSARKNAESILNLQLESRHFRWNDYVKGLGKVERGIRRMPDDQREKVAFGWMPHHLCHGASVFFSSPFSQAAILTLDNSRESTTTLLAKGEEKQILPLQSVDFPHSLGGFYSAITQFLGFEPGLEEDKVMDLSAHGDKKRFENEMKKAILINQDGSFKLNLDLFSHHTMAKYLFTRKFTKIFGMPRKVDSEINQRHMDLAAAAQNILEEAALALALRLYDLTGFIDLCLAGGIASNTLLNSRLSRETPFQNVFVQPAPGNDGAALGAALYLNIALCGCQRGAELNHAHLGVSFTEQECRSALLFSGLTPIKAENIQEKAAKALMNGKIVGWFQGRMEFGPRALGARSILADPRKDWMKDHLNARIKQREFFRPFGVSVLSEKAGQWFENGDIYSPFSSFVQGALANKKALIPSAMNKDGKVQIQTVEKDALPKFHGLLSSFEELTKVPMVLNTSFNLRGKPIVANPKEAIACFLESGIDCLALGPYWLEKPKRIA